jgi:hypothetical protein
VLGSSMNLFPPSSHLPIKHLAAIFTNTTNSYKYFFLFSILEIIERNSTYPLREISLDEIRIGLLATAWYPHNFFRLSFGKQDKISDALDQIQPLMGQQEYYPLPTRLKAAIRKSNCNDQLLRFVPFRLLRPFFKSELKGLPDHQIDSAIRKLAGNQFENSRPFYRFSEDESAIIVHPAWHQYFQQHSRIIKAFIAWELLQYLQKHNPGSPSLSKKVFPTMHRESMHFQTEYWKTVASKIPLTCIYSNNPLKKFQLDHFLPWSFLAHNELWNLIPVNSAANLSKFNSLPAPHYFGKFIEVQFSGLQIYKNLANKRKWDKVADSFLTGLHLIKTDLLNPDTFHRAYKKTYDPLFQMAENHGFTANWRYP